MALDMSSANAGQLQVCGCVCRCVVSACVTQRPFSTGYPRVLGFLRGMFFLCACALMPAWLGCFDTAGTNRAARLTAESLPALEGGNTDVFGSPRPALRVILKPFAEISLSVRVSLHFFLLAARLSP